MDIPLFVTSFFEATEISILEAIMLICFGISWPVSVSKALKTKIVIGKSPLFMSLVAIGYASGISHKILYSRDYLVVLYMFNLSMILIDLYLYTKYNLRGDAERTAQARKSGESVTLRHPITIKPDLR
jgi:hypothetical protein